MKVGVLTLPLIDNYGGIVQAVALCSYLEAQGHEVILIQKAPSASPQDSVSALKKGARWLLLKLPFHDIKSLKASHAKKLLSARKKEFHRNFIESAIQNRSGDLYTTNDLKRFAEKERFDSIIVGSDQVWRKRYINDPYYQTYFLDFVDGKACKKIAYAASFGTDHWEGEGDAENIAKLLSDFHAVSSREQSGVQVCRNTFRYSDVAHLLDPTLIVDKDFYVSQIIEKHVARDFKSSDLMTYVLDEEEEKAKIIQKAASATNADSIMHLKGFDRTGRLYSVPEWLAGFLNARFVVTDSFHGMLFSIIFEKNFIAIGNHGRGMERFTSLLSQLNLSERLVFSESDLAPDLFVPIDYKSVNERLVPLKERSINFLMDALG